MQKKGIALAVAAVLAAPMAAHAGVEVYGKARLSFGSISNDDPASTNDSSKIAVSSHASRLGFKGSEDLENGMKAVWQIERSVDFTDKSTTLGVRNTFAGLAGDFGTVLLGAHDTPYKIATSSLDPLSDTFADYNAVIDSAHDARAANVLAYISPSMSGFTGAVAFVGDVVDDNLADTTPDQSSPAISLAGMYGNGPLYVSLAYQSITEYSKDATAGVSLPGVGSIADTCSAAASCGDATATKLGVGYKMGSFNVGLVYESTSLDFSSGGSIDQANTYLSAVMDAGNGLNVKAAYGMKDDLDANGTINDTGSTFFALGAGKSLSKNTEVYALYTSIATGKNAPTGGAANTGSGNLGVGNQVIRAVGDGTGDAKASAIVVGINLNFSSM